MFSVRTYVTSPGQVTVTVRGELDLAAAPTLATALDGMAEPDIRSAVVELADLTFIDARGVTALLDGRRRAADAGIALHARNATGLVGRVLAITGGDTVLRPVANQPPRRAKTTNK